MVCEHCKMREATVKYVEVINGVKSEHNLCAHCAARLDIGQYSSFFEGEFPLGKLLSGLLGMQGAQPDTEKLSEVVCPTCGTTYEEFVEESQFGCPDCYSVFGPLIRENIRHLQGSEQHVGKRPKGYETESAGRDSEAPEKAGGKGEEKGAEVSGENAAKLSLEEQINRLQSRLMTAVRQEDFETAAVLRDQIRELKEEKKRDGKMV